MNIRCHGCGRHFRVRQDRLPSQGARTRCPRCDEVLVIAPPVAETEAVTVTTPADGRGDLFQLPTAELVAVQDDLFALDGTSPSDQQDQAGEGTQEQEVFAPDPYGTEAGQEARRPGGLRGWLGRLFGRES